MSVDPRRQWATAAAWAARTRSGRRRARDRRLATLRRFGEAQGWSVLGLHQDLTTRYPLAPLLGAASAQAELALTGTWQQWSAVVASVLVRPSSPATRAQRDSVVQLTILDTGPSVQFTATWHPGGPDLVLLTRTDADVVVRIEELLWTEAQHGRLLAGDHVAADELEMLHMRSLDVPGVLDVIGPLTLLTDFASTLR